MLWKMIRIIIKRAFIGLCIAYHGPVSLTLYLCEYALAAFFGCHKENVYPNIKHTESEFFYSEHTHAIILYFISSSSSDPLYLPYRHASVYMGWLLCTLCNFGRFSLSTILTDTHILASLGHIIHLRVIFVHIYTSIVDLALGGSPSSVQIEEKEVIQWKKNEWKRFTCSVHTR